jgi:ParB/RepB/Spo0J family partition protein
VSRVVDLRVDLIDDGANVRPFADAGLQSSLAELGMLQPITVARDGRRYRVLYGHRRLAAARALRWETVPAIVSRDVPERLGLAQVAENIDRRGLSPLAIARALQAELEAHPELTQAQLAERLGRTAVYVSNKLALLRLPDEVQERIQAGELNEHLAIRQRRRLEDGRGRPRIVSEPDEEGRSRSINIEIGSTGHGPRKGVFSIGVEHDSRTVDLVVEDRDRRIFLTLTPEEAKLLGRRFTQAWEAIA